MEIPMFGMKKKINLSHLNQHMTKCGPEGEGNNVTKFVVLLNHKPNPKKILLLEQGWVQWVFALFYGFNPCCADPSMTQLSGTAAVCWISFWSFCWVRCQWKGLGVWAALSLWVSLRLAQTGLCVSTGSPQGCELWDCVQGCRVLPACSGFPQRRGWCDVMWCDSFLPHGICTSTSTLQLGKCLILCCYLQPVPCAVNTLCICARGWLSACAVWITNPVLCVTPNLSRGMHRENTAGGVRQQHISECVRVGGDSGCSSHGK